MTYASQYTPETHPDRPRKGTLLTITQLLPGQPISTRFSRKQAHHRLLTVQDRHSVGALNPTFPAPTVDCPSRQDWNRHQCRPGGPVEEATEDRGRALPYQPSRQNVEATLPPSQDGQEGVQARDSGQAGCENDVLARRCKLLPRRMVVRGKDRGLLRIWCWSLAPQPRSLSYRLNLANLESRSLWH